MQRGYRPSLDASYEERASILVGVVEEVVGSLIGRDSHQRDALVDRLEPNNLRPVLAVVAEVDPIALAAFSVCAIQSV